KRERADSQRQQGRSQWDQVSRRNQKPETQRRQEPGVGRPAQRTNEFRQQRDAYTGHSEQTLFPKPRTHLETSPSRLSRIGHSLSGPQPSQRPVIFANVFFITSRVRIFSSISAILISARARICSRFVPGFIRRARSSRISPNEKPSSCARLMKCSLRAVSVGKSRYPASVRGGFGRSPSRS